MQERPLSLILKLKMAVKYYIDYSKLTRLLRRYTMKQIDSLYKKLVVDQDASSKKAKIDEKIRSQLHKKILDELEKLSTKPIMCLINTIK